MVHKIPLYLQNIIKEAILKVIIREISTEIDTKQNNSLRDIIAYK